MSLSRRAQPLRAETRYTRCRWPSPLPSRSDAGSCLAAIARLCVRVGPPATGSPRAFALHTTNTQLNALSTTVRAPPKRKAADIGGRSYTLLPALCSATAKSSVQLAPTPRGTPSARTSKLATRAQHALPRAVLPAAKNSSSHE